MAALGTHFRSGRGQSCVISYLEFLTDFCLENSNENFVSKGRNTKEFIMQFLTDFSFENINENFVPKDYIKRNL